MFVCFKVGDVVGYVYDDDFGYVFEYVEVVFGLFFFEGYVDMSFGKFMIGVLFNFEFDLKDNGYIMIFVLM